MTLYNTFFVELKERQVRLRVQVTTTDVCELDSSGSCSKIWPYKVSIHFCNLDSKTCIDFIQHKFVGIKKSQLRLHMQWTTSQVYSQFSKFWGVPGLLGFPSILGNPGLQGILGFLSSWLAHGYMDASLTCSKIDLSKHSIHFQNFNSKTSMWLYTTLFCWA